MQPHTIISCSLELLMPTLDWIGKKAVLNHHREVPYRLIKCEKGSSVGSPENGNLLLEGDNLVALKALLPFYTGQIKCIYIDPPYNTGNENWTYNDAVNSLEMRSWLGKVVGAEAEDLSRHDKWLCMMYPRLSLLKQFLCEDGAIFVSIDDNEIHNLRLIMDEIFGPRNFIATIVWQNVYTIKNSAKYLSDMHDYIVVYAKRKPLWKRNLRPRDESTDEDYSNPDDDPNGPWISHALQSRNKYSKGIYSITCPGGRIISGPPTGTYWRVAETKFKDLDIQGRVWWGLDNNGIPRIKDYLKNVKEGVVPTTWWTYTYAGTNSNAKVQLRDMIGDSEMFITPKPVDMISRIIELATDKDSLILDSFAGSGTTGHAVLSANKADGGSRQFILIEMEKDICFNVTAKRLKRAILGYERKQKVIEGLGGGFRYCMLSSPLFNEEGVISNEVKFTDLASYVYFTETGQPLIEAESPRSSPLLGVHEGVAIYLLYNGILGDKTIDGGNVLTSSVLISLPPHDGPKTFWVFLASDIDRQVLPGFCCRT